MAERKDYIPVYERIEQLIKLVDSNNIVGYLSFSSDTLKAINDLRRTMQALERKGVVNKTAFTEPAKALFKGIVEDVAHTLETKGASLSAEEKSTLVKLTELSKVLYESAKVFEGRHDVRAVMTKDYLEKWYQSHPEWYSKYRLNMADYERTRQIATRMDFKGTSHANYILPMRGEIISADLFRTLYPTKFFDLIDESISKQPSFKDIVDALSSATEPYKDKDYLKKYVFDKINESIDIALQEGFDEAKINKLRKKMKTIQGTILAFGKSFKLTGMEWDDRVIRDILSKKFEQWRMPELFTPKIIDPLIDAVKKVYITSTTSIKHFISSLAEETAFSEFYTTILTETRKMDRAKVNLSHFPEYMQEISNYINQGATVVEAMSKARKKFLESGWDRSLLASYESILTKGYTKAQQTLKKQVREQVNEMGRFYELIYKALPDSKKSGFKKAFGKILTNMQKAISDVPQLHVATTEALKRYDLVDIAETSVLNVAEQRMAKVVLDLTMASLSVVMTYSIFTRTVMMTAEKFRQLNDSLVSFGISMKDLQAHSQEYIKAVEQFKTAFGKTPKVDYLLANVLDSKRLYDVMRGSSASLGRVSLKDIYNTANFQTMINAMSRDLTASTQNLITSMDSVSKMISGTFTGAIMELVNSSSILRNIVVILGGAFLTFANLITTASNILMMTMATLNFTYQVSEKASEGAIKGFAEWLTKRFESGISLVFDKAIEFIKTPLGKGLLIGALTLLVAGIMKKIYNWITDKYTAQWVENSGLSMDAFNRANNEVYQFAGDINQTRKALKEFYDTLMNINKYKGQNMPVWENLRFEKPLQDYTKQVWEQSKKIVEAKNKLTGSWSYKFLSFLKNTPFGVAQWIFKPTMFKQSEALDNQLKQFKELYDLLQDVGNVDITNLESIKKAYNGINQLLNKDIPEDLKSFLATFKSYLGEQMKVLETYKYRIQEAMKTANAMANYYSKFASAMTSQLRDSTLAQPINTAMNVLNTYKELTVMFGEILDTLPDSPEKKRITAYAKNFLQQLDMSKAMYDYEMAMYQTIQARVNAVGGFFKTVSDNLLGGVGDFLADIYKMYNKAETRRIMQKRWGLSGKIEDVADLLLNKNIVSVLKVKAKERYDELEAEIRKTLDYELNKNIQAFNKYKQFTPIFSVFSRGIDTILTSLTAEGQYQFSLYSKVMTRLFKTEFGKIIYMSDKMKFAILRNDPIAFATQVLVNDINKAIASLPNQVKGSEFMQAVLQSMALESLGNTTAQKITDSLKEAFEEPEWKKLAEDYKKAQEVVVESLKNIKTSIESLDKSFSDINNELKVHGKYLSGIKSINAEFTKFVPESGKVKSALAGLNTMFNTMKKSIKSFINEIDPTAPKKKLDAIKKRLNQGVSDEETEVYKPKPMFTETYDTTIPSPAKPKTDQAGHLTYDEWVNVLANAISNAIIDALSQPNIGIQQGWSPVGVGGGK